MNLNFMQVSVCRKIGQHRIFATFAASLEVVKSKESQLYFSLPIPDAKYKFDLHFYIAQSSGTWLISIMIKSVDRQRNNRG